MKNQTVILLICLLAAYFVSAKNPTCSEHPIFQMAKPFLTRSVKGHETASQMMNDFIDEFTKATPSDKSAKQLGVCGFYAGQQTCCTEQMVNFLDKAASYSGSEIQNAGTPVDQFIKLFKKAMKENSCSSTLDSLSVQDILNDPKNYVFKTYYNSVRDAKLLYSQLIAVMNRGAMCAICAGVDTVTDYMSDGKVLVDSLTTEQYLQVISTLWDYMGSIYKNIDAFTLSMSELFYNYASETCLEDINMPVQKAMLYSIAAFDFSQYDPENPLSLRCSGTVLYNEKPLCETAQSNISQLDEFIQSYTSSFDPSPTPEPNPDPAPGARRNLVADTEDGIILHFGSKGIPTFVDSETDLLISSNGDLLTTFKENSDSNSAKTSLEKLQFISSLAILAIFVF